MHHKPTAGVEQQLLKLAPRVRAYVRVLTCDAAATEQVLAATYRDFLADGPMPGTEHAERWILDRARELALSGRNAPASPTIDPIQRDSGLRRVEEALLGIPPLAREALYLRAVEALSDQRIAQRTDSPPTEVATAVAQAQAAFEARMGQPAAAALAELRRFAEAHAGLPAPALDLTPPRRSARRVFAIVFGAVTLMAATTYYIDQRAMSRHQTPTTAPSRH